MEEGVTEFIVCTCQSIKNAGRSVAGALFPVAYSAVWLCSGLGLLLVQSGRKQLRHYVGPAFKSHPHSVFVNNVISGRGSVTEGRCILSQRLLQGLQPIMPCTEKLQNPYWAGQYKRGRELEVKRNGLFSEEQVFPSCCQWDSKRELWFKYLFWFCLFLSARIKLGKHFFISYAHALKTPREKLPTSQDITMLFEVRIALGCQWRLTKWNKAGSVS